MADARSSGAVPPNQTSHSPASRPAVDGKRKRARDMVNRIHLIASHARDDVAFVRIRPAMSGDDHLVGRGSRPTPALLLRPACNRRILAGRRPRPQSEFTTLVDDGAALLWPDGGSRPTPMEEDRCHSIEA